MKSLQVGEMVVYQRQITVITEQVRVLTDKVENMAKELTGKQELIDVLKGYNLLANERLEDFKKKIREGPSE